MKRSDMALTIANFLIREDFKFPNFEAAQNVADRLLGMLEASGMNPPSVDGETAQCMLSIYQFPSLNVWDEDVEKDEKVQYVKERRIQERKKREAL